MRAALPFHLPRKGGQRPTPLLFASLHGYTRRFVPLDAVAALTLLVIVVPEQLATSRLAGMPPVTGFYALIAGTLLIAVLGSSPQVSVGADSTIAPLFAAGISHLAPTESARYVELVGILAVMVGILVALVGLLRIGWIAEFLSTPIITGFLAGVAVIIVVHQLPDFLGLPAESGTTLHRLVVAVSHLARANGWTLGLGAGVLLIVALAEHINRRVPGALIGLVASTAVVGGFGLSAHGVAVLGNFSHGAPRFGLRGLSLSVVGKLLPLAVVVALVVIIQSAATARAFATRGGHPPDVGRDFLAVGAGSIVAGLSGSFPVDASPPRTAAVVESGGRTQAAGLAAAAALVLLIPAASLLRDVPLATLAAVLLFIASRLFHLRDLVSIARFNLFELGLAVVAFLAVAFIGVEQGIAVAVLLAVLDRARLQALPQLHELGRISGTTSWAPLTSTEPTVQVPDVLVVLFATPLWYVNAEHFRAQMEGAFGRPGGPPRAIVLDVMGMSDIDYTGAQVLREVLDELDERKIGFAVARAGKRLRNCLQHAGLFDRVGADRFFASVDLAVNALEEGLR